MGRVNHYKWLDKHLPKIFEKLGLNWEWNQGIVSAHGDKCYGYRDLFDKNNIPFPHGVACYLLTYLSPFSYETRDTVDGWVDPGEWIVKNYAKFATVMPPVDESDEDLINPWER